MDPSSDGNERLLRFPVMGMHASFATGKTLVSAVCQLLAHGEEPSAWPYDVGHCCHLQADAHHA